MKICREMGMGDNIKKDDMHGKVDLVWFGLNQSKGNRFVEIGK
jgi:hypothetical protein